MPELEPSLMAPLDVASMENIRQTVEGPANNNGQFCSTAFKLSGSIVAQESK
jgi:hypothetical protein